MFRYIALNWDPADPSAIAQAGALGRRLTVDRAWQAALEQPGIQVWVRGTAAGINEAYRICGGQGVVLGKLFRNDDLTLGDPGVPVLRQQDAETIVHSAGRSLVRDFWGRYVAFLPEADGRYSVLRDPSGTLPCYRAEHRGITFVFSWLEDLTALIGHSVASEVDDAALCVQLAGGETSGRATALRGVTQVLAGEQVPLHGAPSAGAFLWDMIDVARSPAIEDLHEAAEQLRQTVRTCVQDWARCYDSILLRLSGGVDSSIVASCLGAGAVPTRVTCVNYHSPGIDSDERHYARQVAERSRLQLIERARSTGFPLPSILDAALTPSPRHHVSRMGSARMDAELATAVSAPAMFTGTGGDQLFFELHQPWPAADYLRNHGLDRGLWKASADAARLGRTTVWSAVKLAFDDWLRPQVNGFARLPGPQLLTDAAAELADQVAQAARQDELAHPAVSASLSLPLGKRRQVQQLVHPVPYHDPFGREEAPELVAPLMSQPVMELCLLLPTYVLTAGGRARGLARRAFASHLPADVVARRAKGGMGDHLSAALFAHRGWVAEMLLDGELVRRGLVDRARTEGLLRGHASALVQHAGQVHACLAMEAWLQRVTRAAANETLA